MRVAGVEWDHANLKHFNEHGRCRHREVEEVLQARCYPTRMAKDGEAMKSKQPRKRWPAGKPIPKFETAAGEERFWLSHDFDDLMEARGEEVVYEPQATRRPRTHVYRVRLDDEEMSTLQTLAKRRGVTASVVLRELVRAARVARLGDRARPAAPAGTAESVARYRSKRRR